MSKSYDDCLSTRIRQGNSTTKEDVLADAAPDLLAACEAARDELLNGCPEDRPTDAMRPRERSLYSQLRAAIAKARNP